MNIFQKAFYNIRRFFGGFGTSLGSKDFHRYYHDLKKNSLYVENMYNKIRKLKYVNKIAGTDQIRTGMKKYISRGVCRFLRVVGVQLRKQCIII